MTRFLNRTTGRRYYYKDKAIAPTTKVVVVQTPVFLSKCCFGPDSGKIMGSNGAITYTYVNETWVRNERLKWSVVVEINPHGYFPNVEFYRPGLTRDSFV